MTQIPNKGTPIVELQRGTITVPWLNYLQPLSLLATEGDMLVEGATGPKTLPLGTKGYMLTSNGTDVVWSPVFLNVKDYGAVGDNTTDDTTAIQNCINDADSNGGYGVFFPPGSYYTATGLTVSGRSIKLFALNGGSNGKSIISSKGADVTVVNLTGFASSIEGILVSGGGLGSTHAAVVMGGVECTMFNCRVTGGAQAIRVTSSDVIIFDVHAESAYSNAILSVQSANGYFYRCKLDQNFPTGVTPSSLPSAWAATHSYTANTVVSIGSGSYYIQCKIGGTSGGSEPAAANYGTDIVDGGATWRLVGPVGYSSLKVDNSFSAIFHGCDHTGPFQNGILFSDDHSAGGPQNIVITDAVVGTCFSNGINVSAGEGYDIKGCQVSSCIDTSAGTAINISGGNGDISITNNLLLGSVNGVRIQAGTGHIVSSNKIYNCTDGVRVSAAIKKFVISGNSLGSSSTWGSNTNAVVVDVGASDHYNIVNNIVNGAGSGVTDGGSGVNKTITGNV